MRRTHGPLATAPAADRLRLPNEGVVWLVAAALLGLIGWYKSVNLVLMLAYLMLALLALNGVLARVHARRVEAAREPTPPVYVGEDAAMRLTVTNTGTRPATATVEDRAGGVPFSWLVSGLAPGALVVCSARRTFPARGRFPSPALRVASGFPFGLLLFERPGGPGGDLVVLPAPGRVQADGLRRWVLRQAVGDGRARRVLRRVTTDHADVRGVRPYRPGDSMRDIHWRSSARRGEWMVREYDVAPAPDLVLVVEPWLPADPTRAELTALEDALSLAVSVARAWAEGDGSKVTVAVAGDPDSVRAATPGEAGLREALAPLAGVAGGVAFAPLTLRAFDRPLARVARILVSSRANSPYAGDLARATGRPFPAVAPADRPPWYQPPTTLV